MMTSLLSRKDRLIRIDPREADDLIALLQLVGIPCGAPTAGSQPGEVCIPLPSTVGDAELGRAEAILLEFNRMRSTRAMHHAQDN
ncbi:hypothetical protein SAMN05444166_2987 [Singulisphaera sp. GP187]|uniref:hypothetical protein n=1 Tax=Singulisphaera sp. GP187 TaxID=1882752 RepID=UPI000926E187|nr:hypothetical protein [Singulisphaera sp. GP187]SIO20555.1 hypothetical protein SAMN05444166_2987 [Singulisphaera sp. GP187]